MRGGVRTRAIDGCLTRRKDLEMLNTDPQPPEPANEFDEPAGITVARDDLLRVLEFVAKGDTYWALRDAADMLETACPEFAAQLRNEVKRADRETHGMPFSEPDFTEAGEIIVLEYQRAVGAGG